MQYFAVIKNEIFKEYSITQGNVYDVLLNESIGIHFFNTLDSNSVKKTFYTGEVGKERWRTKEEPKKMI